MTWTSNKPKEPGFYFYHPMNGDPNHIWIAQVTRVLDKSRGLYCSLAEFRYGPRDSHQPINYFRGMWSGPISNPGPCHG